MQYEGSGELHFHFVGKGRRRHLDLVEGLRRAPVVQVKQGVIYPSLHALGPCLEAFFDRAVL